MVGLELGGRNPLKCLESPPPKILSSLCVGNTKGRGNPGLLDLHLTEGP